MLLLRVPDNDASSLELQIYIVYVRSDRYSTSSRYVSADIRLSSKMSALANLCSGANFPIPYKSGTQLYKASIIWLSLCSIDDVASDLTIETDRIIASFEITACVKLIPPEIESRGVVVPAKSIEKAWLISTSSLIAFEIPEVRSRISTLSQPTLHHQTTHQQDICKHHSNYMPIQCKKPHEVDNYVDLRCPIQHRIFESCDLHSDFPKSRPERCLSLAFYFCLGHGPHLATLGPAACSDDGGCNLENHQDI